MSFTDNKKKISTFTHAGTTSGTVHAFVQIQIPAAITSFSPEDVP